MSHQFLLSPQGLERLQQSGLASRADKLLKSHEWFGLSHFMAGDEEQLILDLQDRGYFHRPIHELREYSRALDAFAAGERSWKVQGRTAEELHWEDFPVWGGYHAAKLLRPARFWQPARAGFENVFDLHGCVGAYLAGARNDIFREGYRWTSQEGDRTFTSEITGSEHGDLRMFRTDITWQETTHPSGLRVNYRPLTDADRQVVWAYHSTEQTLLAAVLKYVDQLGLKPDTLQENGRALLAEFQERPQYTGFFADFGTGSGSPEHDAVMRFLNYDLPLPTLVLDMTDEPTAYWLGTDADALIGVYVDDQQRLCLSREERGKPSPSKRITARFPPHDVDHLVRGLFTQAQKGLGRTSMRQLRDIIEYRYSDRFDQDQQRWREMVRS